MRRAHWHGRGAAGQAAFCCRGPIRQLRRILFLLLLSAGADAQAPGDLSGLSLEELMDIEVFTAARHDQELRHTPAAAAVLTAADLRRTGVTTIPEALRLIPGIEVARIDAGKWAVTARGFNDLFANKLLVLIDGRSVYSPLFSGVFWDVQAVPVEEIERIEVVRGPGAALWGANAVNGIVNIITRSGGNDTARRLSLGAGAQEQRHAGAAWSGPIGRQARVRVYADGAEHGVLTEDRTGTREGWRLWQIGLRADGRLSSRDSLTVDAGVSDAESRQVYEVSLSAADTLPRIVPWTTPAREVHVLARWHHRRSADEQITLQAAYQHGEREDAPAQGRTDVVDIDLQHRLRPTARLDMIWGAGYRRTQDRVDGSFAARFDPVRRQYDQLSGFAQATLRDPQRNLRVTLGGKLENFDLGGLALQPNLRAAWTPDAGRMWWAGVSQAVRTPSRSDHDLRARKPAPAELVPPGFPTTYVEERGSADFQPEEVTALEAGFRGQLTRRFAIDVAAFHNRYERLRTTEPGFPVADSSGAGAYLVVPLNVDNRMSARTLGVEVAADWRPGSTWRLRPAYTWFWMDVDLEPGSAYKAGLTWEGVSPRHQLLLRASVDPTPGLQVDLSGRYIGALRDIGVDGYVSVDARLGWRLRSDLVLELVGHDLLERRHAEFRIPHLPVLTADPRRGVRLGLRWDLGP